MIPLETNICLLTDAYKQTHHFLYPADTEYIVSYLESRGGEFPYVVPFGLQITLKKYLEGCVVTQRMIDEADIFCDQMFGTGKYRIKVNKQSVDDVVDAIIAREKADGGVIFLDRTVMNETQIDIDRVIDLLGIADQPYRIMVPLTDKTEYGFGRYYMAYESGCKPYVVNYTALAKREIMGATTTNVINIDDYEIANPDVKTFFNREGWELILNRYGGRLPIEIRSVPEGTVVPPHNVLMTITNTDPDVPFIVNFVETLLVQMWHPTTVATFDVHLYRLLDRYAKLAGEAVSPFHINDFAYRGVSSVETAGYGGAAHLMVFAGTDTIEGIEYAMQYYNAPVCGYSVIAAEHSTVTTYGRDYEEAAYARYLEVCPDNATVSIVCDSYDTLNAVGTMFCGSLRDKIAKRKGKIVLRPDSGDPVEMSVQIANLLWDAFGGTVNEQGYKVLPDQVGIIYGDGIGFDDIRNILDALVLGEKFAPSCIIFGMGGHLQQMWNRDTMRFAMKCSAVRRNGEWHDVYKDPVTDPGKVSKRGRLKLVRDVDGYKTCRIDEYPDLPDNLVTVFKDGVIVKEYSIGEIRDRIQSAIGLDV